MLIGILGMGSIGDRHALNCMRLGHQVIYYDPLREGSLPREKVIELADAVLICTPTKQHVPDLVDVLAASKNVLVEKPIGYDCPPFIAGLITGAKSKRPDLVVATGFMLRFHPKVIQAKNDVARLGNIRLAQFQVLQKNTKPEYLRDGVLRNWASHEIDLARHLLGNLEVERCQDMEMFALIQMTSIEHACPVYIEADYVTNPEIRGFEIMGDLGRTVVDLTQSDWDQVYLDELQAFVNACHGGDAGPLADGYDGVAALQIVMDARQKAGLDD